MSSIVLGQDPVTCKYQYQFKSNNVAYFWYLTLILVFNDRAHGGNCRKWGRGPEYLNIFRIKTLHHFHRFSGLVWASVGLPGECGEWNRTRNIISQYNWHPAADSSPSPTVTLPLLATFSYSYNLTIKSYTRKNFYE